MSFDLSSLRSRPLPELWGGAECTINRVGNRFRDQVRLSGHDERPDDLERFAELGLTALRYPLLWETFARSDDPEGLWAWHDTRLNLLLRLQIRPILGLIHHGSGPPVTNLLDVGFVAGLAGHAAVAARRYPWVTDWSPVNEPTTTARFAALYGHWYPHAREESAFWLALINQIDGVRAAMSAIRAVNPGARLIQTEDVGFTSATPERRDQAEYNNLRCWSSWDLLTGRFTRDHPLWQRLVDIGLYERLQSIAELPCPPDVMGLNHYLTSDRFLDHRVEQYPANNRGEGFFGPIADIEAVRVIDHTPGLAGALRSCWERYRLPIAITEVHNGCTREEQMRWLQEAWDTAVELRSDGVPVEAVTVWSLLGAFDWDSLLTRNDGHYESGVFDLRTKPPRATALAPMLRALASGQNAAHPVLAGAGWWRRGIGATLADSFVRNPARCESRPIVICGASGTLGQAFAGACRLRDIAFVLTGRDVMDLRNCAAMGLMLDRLKPWAVINCAGWVRVDDAENHGDECLAANFTGNVALAAACRQRDIHYTCFSSDLVFDGRECRTYVESDATAPLNVYGKSKAKADDELEKAGGRTLVVRTASFFSPFDQHNFAFQLVEALRAGRAFRAAADCVTSPTYVPDLVSATLDLIIDDECGLWHLANAGGLTWAEFGYAIGNSLNLSTSTMEVRCVTEMEWIAQRPLHAPITTDRGLIMPSLESAIERFASETIRMTRAA